MESRFSRNMPKRDAAKAERTVTSIVGLCRIYWGWGGEKACNKGKCKLFANIAILVLLCEAPVWDDAINTKAHRATEMV